MAEPYKIVIGLEVHVQLLTKTKLFCGCSTQFGLPPNTATCPVCLGMPGVLPVMNRKAFELSLKAAVALNCEINRYTKWDRKNYYYPDLPKNFQTSQFDLPFCGEGFLQIPTSSGPKQIRIDHIHLEEDAGKMLHDEKGTGRNSLVDLNRTGTPLLEIVSKPDMNAPEEARAYLEEIRLLMRELGVSDCEMQEGSLRCDANINLHIPLGDGNFVATPIVEVKNLNSIRSVERAMKYEAERQFKEYQKTKITIDSGDKATAAWDENRGLTFVMRRKEMASDYRYFPEPDLMPVVVDDAWLDRVRAEMGELPSAARARLQSQHQLSEYDADVIVRQGKAFLAYFEEVAAASGDSKDASNWMTNQVLAYLNDEKIDIHEFEITAANLADLVRRVRDDGIPKSQAKKVFAKMIETGEDAGSTMEAMGLRPITDEGEILEFVQKAIEANPKAVADYQKGKKKAAEAIKGAVMRETNGMAKVEVISQLLAKELQALNGSED